MGLKLKRANWVVPCGTFLHEIAGELPAPSIRSPLLQHDDVRGIVPLLRNVDELTENLGRVSLILTEARDLHRPTFADRRLL